MSSDQDLRTLRSKQKQIIYYFFSLVFLSPLSYSVSSSHSKSVSVSVQPESVPFPLLCLFQIHYMTWSLYHGLSLPFPSPSQRLSLSPCLFLNCYLSHCRSRLMSLPLLDLCKPLLKSVPLRTWPVSINLHFSAWALYVAPPVSLVFQHPALPTQSLFWVDYVHCVDSLTFVVLSVFPKPSS